jgi:hypothetical protein
MKLWLNARERAEYAGVYRDTVYATCKRREIRHARVSTQDRGRVARMSSSESLQPEATS